MGEAKKILKLMSELLDEQKGPKEFKLNKATKALTFEDRKKTKAPAGEYEVVEPDEKDKGMTVIANLDTGALFIVNNSVIKG